MIGLAAGEPQIVQRFRVDGEETNRGTVLGSHVGDRGTIGKAETGKAGTVELDKLTNDAFRSKHLRHCEDKVGGRRAFRHLAEQPETDHLRNQHGV